MFARRSGILLHVTSLPGSHGIGDLGDSAHEFIEFLAGTGQKIWQVLPLNPTGYGDSPYQGFSAFAGNPLLIDLDAVREQGLLSRSELPQAPAAMAERIDYGWVIEFKLGALRLAGANFFSQASQAQKNAFTAFCRNNAH